MTEDQLEQETLAWLAEVGYAVHPGLAIAPDGATPQRADYRQVVLAFRLREAIGRLNPAVPTAAREDALQQVLNLGLPASSRPTAPSTSCWWAACRCSTSAMARRWATSCA